LVIRAALDFVIVFGAFDVTLLGALTSAWSVEAGDCLLSTKFPTLSPIRPPIQEIAAIHDLRFSRRDPAASSGRVNL
jgi:hypothetical protein